MKLKDLIENLDYIEIDGNTDIEIKGINYDSRKVELSGLFAALHGVNFDGRDYIPAAVSHGAIATITEPLSENHHFVEGIVYIIVADARKALAHVAHVWKKRPTETMNIVGVTGTNGKTTITFLVQSILNLANKRAAILGTTGVYFDKERLPTTHTTPESLELAETFSKLKSRGAQYAAMEVSSHALAQSRANEIKYKVAAFTNLTHDHLDYHKTVEDYAAAKRILFDNLKTEATAIVNGDDAYANFMLENCRAQDKIKVGRKRGNDVVIKNEKLGLDDTTFDLIFKSGDNISIKTRLLGGFNIDNAAFAAVICRALGIDDKHIIAGLAKTPGAPGRMERIKLKNGAIGIVDYSHTPDALEKALISCRELINTAGSQSKLICVFGCGGDRDKTKRPIMGEIASRLADYSIITDDNPRTEDPEEILKDIAVGVNPKNLDKCEVLAGRELAIAKARILAKSGDIILVAGKGHENYQIIGTIKHDFDDALELAK